MEDGEEIGFEAATIGRLLARAGVPGSEDMLPAGDGDLAEAIALSNKIVKVVKSIKKHSMAKSVS